MQSLEDDGQYRNGWLIYTRTKSFSVYAATATEKQEWMAHIDKCIRDLLHKNGKKAATEHAAPWVPDTEAATCMVCNKSQFTLLNRRVKKTIIWLFFFSFSILHNAPICLVGCVIQKRITCILVFLNYTNIFFLQHHCRKCGSVVCGNCSSRKLNLPAQSTKPLRVCDRCYDSSTTRSTDPNPNWRKCICF